MRRAGAGLLLAAAAVGCRSNDPPGAGAAPIPIGPGAARPGPAETRAALARRAIDEAARFIREGDRDAARDRLERLGGADLPDELAAARANLFALLEAEEWAARLAPACVVDSAAEAFEAGEPIRLRLRFGNPGKVGVAFLGPPAGATLGSLRLAYLERRPDGTDVRETRTEAIAIPPLTIAAGEVASVEWEGATLPEAGYALREYEASFDVRPADFRADGRRLPLPRLAFARCRFRVFPRGYEAVAADPLGALRRALAAPSASYDRHPVLAAALVAPGERDEAIDACREALSRADGRRRRSAAAALRVLTGRDDLPPDPETWRARLGIPVPLSPTSR